MGRHPIILVTGARGQVGRALRELVPDATYLGREDLDVTDRDAVQRAVRDATVVVHLAALTNVDGCEAEPERAHLVNHVGTRNIAEAAAERSSRVIYLSTDYVFDGNATSEYAETDAPHPLNVYGRTKLAGETEIAQVPDHWIVRTSWIFGEGKNFIRTILNKASKEPLRVVDDQVGRPSAARAVAEGVRFLMGKPGDGILHVAGDGSPCSWADLAEFALRCAGSDATIERISTEDYERGSASVVAPRPRHSVLSIENARELGVPLLDWRATVREEIGSMR